MANDILNVSFLKGTQSKLDSLTNYQAGAFYLTNDTDRLYFAQSNSELVYLNKYITTVPGKDDLPSRASTSVGDFYYVAGLNALVVNDGTKWAQINPPDTNDDISLVGASFSSLAKDGNIVVSYSLTQAKKDLITGTEYKDSEGNSVVAPITGSFTISGSDIGAVVTNIALDVNASVANNIATIELTGEGVADDATGFTIKGGNNVTLTGNNNEITIAATDTTYTLSSEANSTNIVLKDDKGTPNTINIVAGESNPSLSVTGVNSNEIVVSHKDYSFKKDALGNQTVANAGSFNIISGVTLENGHITDIATSSVTLPNMTYRIDSVDADNEGKIHVKLVDFAGTGDATISEQVLYYTVKGEHVYNQAELNNYFYTKDEIDTTLKGANAMVFKGDVGDTSETNQTLPTENVSAGDTYIVVGDTVVSGSGNFGHKGDLFIATGTEGDNGYLTDITWIYVPAGNEIDTTYTFNFIPGRGLVIKNNASGNETTLKFTGDNAIDVNVVAVTENDVTANVLQVTHKEVTRDDENSDQTLGSETQFTVVTDIESNSQGHITKVVTKNVTMPREDTYSLAREDNNTVELRDKDGSADGILKISAGNKLVVSSVDILDDNSNSKGADFTISHNTATVGNETAVDVQLNALNESTNNTFTVITGIENDGYGHLSKITTTKYTMPYDSTYTYSGNVTAENNIATVTTQLKDRLGTGVGTAAFTLNSNTLNLSATGTAITADLQWGSF